MESWVKITSMGEFPLILNGEEKDRSISLRESNIRWRGVGIPPWK
jgi:hypothetical protein